MTKVLITGAAGFIGHHIVEHILKNTDWEIYIIDRLSYSGDLNRLADIDIWEKERYRVKFIYHDLKSPIPVSIMRMLEGVDYVLHEAANTHVDRSLVDAKPFVLDNIFGTVNLLDCFREIGCKKIIIQGTDEIFGAAPKGYFYKENDRYAPSNPYAASKVGQWMMAYSYAHAFGMPILHAIMMNGYGERQHPEKFIPKTVKAVIDGRKIVLHGKNKHDVSSRCWIHARDIADALLFLLEKGKPKESYNVVGPEYTVYELADKIFKIIKGRSISEDDIEWVDYHSARPGHDLRYALDGSKIKKIGWKPRLPFDVTFEKCIRWMADPKNSRWLEG